MFKNRQNKIIMFRYAFISSLNIKKQENDYWKLKMTFPQEGRRWVQERIHVRWVIYSVTYGCCCLVGKSCPTLLDPMDSSPPGSSVHGIFQARILERVAISFSRGTSLPRDQTWVSCFGRKIPYYWARREALWLMIFLHY